MNIEKAILRAVDKAKKSANFLVPSKDRTYPLPVGDKMIFINPKRLVLGNAKLVDILIFDLPAGSIENGGSCHNSKFCEKTCYAKNQQNQYLNSKVFRLVNLFMLLNHKDELKRLILEQIGKSRYKTMRIHSSGDFFNNDEITMWDSIIDLHPKINFYAYTKVNKIFDLTALSSHKNFNLIHSLIEDKYLNYGSMNYLKMLEREHKAFICPATVYEDIKCNKDCSYCVTENKPCFVIHGTKAKKHVKKSKDEFYKLKIKEKFTKA